MTVASETQDKTFGEITARVEPLGAKKGRRLLVKLSRIVAPALGALVGSGSAVDLGPAKLERMATLLATHMHEDDVDALLTTMIPQTRFKKDESSDFVAGTEAIFDLLFAGRYMDQLRFLAFCLEVNYAGFLDEIKESGAVAAFLAPDAPSPSLRD